MKLLESWLGRCFVATATLMTWGTVNFFWAGTTGQTGVNVYLATLFGFFPINLIPSVAVGAVLAIFKNKTFLTLLIAPIIFHFLLNFTDSSFASKAVGLGVLVTFIYYGIVRPQSDKRADKIIFSGRKHKGVPANDFNLLELKKNSSGELVLEVTYATSPDKKSFEDKIPSIVLRAGKVKVAYDPIIDTVSKSAPGYISSTGEVYKGGSWTEKVNSGSVMMRIYEADADRDAFQMMADKKLIAPDARLRLFGSINRYYPNALKTEAQRNEPEPIYGNLDLKSTSMSVDRSELSRVQSWFRQHQNVLNQKDAYAISNAFFTKVMADARKKAGKDLKGKTAISSDERGNLIFFAEINRNGEVVLVENGRLQNFSRGKEGAEALLSRREMVLDTMGGQDVINMAEYVKNA